MKALCKNIGRTIDAVGSVGNLAVDAVEGVIGMGSTIKKTVGTEVDSLQYERNLENAVSRIKAKAEAIKEVMNLLNVSAEEAESLIEKEMSKCS